MMGLPRTRATGVLAPLVRGLALRLRLERCWRDWPPWGEEETAGAKGKKRLEMDSSLSAAEADDAGSGATSGEAAAAGSPP